MLIEIALPVLRKAWWKIILLSLAVGLAMLLLLFLQSNYYRSRAIIAPTGDDTRQAGPLGALASLGLPIGASSKIEDLESLFKSDDLTARVFSQHDLWKALFGDRYDETHRLLKHSMIDRLKGRKPGPPTDWDAIRAAEEALRVATNKKSGTLTITVEALTPESAAEMVTDYLDEAKSRLQEEATLRAQRNKKFLEEQIAGTADTLSRDKLFTLLGQELEKEMMARNREEFGFKVIDRARVPDRKAGPMRGVIAVLVTLVSLFSFSYLFVQLSLRRSTLAAADAPKAEVSSHPSLTRSAGL